MHNKDLALDYITRASHRLEALKVLLARESYADVVRESQEIVELCLKALLRKSNIEVPRIHDVSDIIKKEQDRLSPIVRPSINRLCQISKHLRRDRELSFYGTEDLTPSEFYVEDDALQASHDANWVYSVCQDIFK